MDFIILGDLHLGKGHHLGKSTIGTSLNSRVIDQFNLLDWTFDQSIGNNYCPIIITGDVFEDPTPPITVLLKLTEWLKKCSINNIEVHIIAGNHDIYRTGNFYTSYLDVIMENEIDGVYFYKDITTIFINNVGVTLVPYRDRRSLEVNNLAEGLEYLKNIIKFESTSIPNTYVKVCVGHLAFEGSIPVGDELGDIANELFLTKEIMSDYNYTWLGHIHKPQVMCKSPYIAHIGSMDISNFGELDQEKVIILFNNNSFNELIIPTRKFKNIEISVPENTTDTTKFILEELEKNEKEYNNSIIKLNINLDSIELLPASKKEIEKYLISKGVANLSNFSQTKKTTVLKKDKDKSIDTKIDILSAIKKYSQLNIKEEDQTAFENLCLVILKDQNANT